MDTIIIAVISVTAIGAVCATVLSIASKLMHVKVDERLGKIRECLPGTNCGACGFPGCDGYAEALHKDPELKTSLCTPGGADVMASLNAVLGIETGDEITPKAAFIHCGGSADTRQSKMEYTGIKTCAAAKQVFGGEGSCALGCIGYGDCQTVCPADAICMENGIARINMSLCGGCALCVKACPNGLITIDNASVRTVVMCANTEKGAVVRKKCAAGCIACSKCARECPSGAITVADNLAKVDYDKCVGCGHCAEICVTKCIDFRAG